MLFVFEREREHWVFVVFDLFASGRARVFFSYSTKSALIIPVDS